jgi:hypothetical protein
MSLLALLFLAMATSGGSTPPSPSPVVVAAPSSPVAVPTKPIAAPKPAPAAVAEKEEEEEEEEETAAPAEEEETAAPAEEEEDKKKPFCNCKHRRRRLTSTLHARPHPTLVVRLTALRPTDPPLIPSLAWLAPFPSGRRLRRNGPVWRGLRQLRL